MQSKGQEICKAISIAINKSISTGSSLQFSKLQKLPIYKNKDQILFSNYPPISTLHVPSISKVLEKMIHSLRYRYLQLNKMDSVWIQEGSFH